MFRFSGIVLFRLSSLVGDIGKAYSPMLATPLYLTSTMPETSDTPVPSALQQASGRKPTSLQDKKQPLSPEDKLVLYSVFQDLANEIRRIDHERKKHQQETELAHNPLDS